MNLTPILQPGQTAGFISAQSPTALPPGFQALIQNGRLHAGIVEARDGDTTLTNVGGATTTNAPRGFYIGMFDGVLTAFEAIYDSSAAKVLVYKSLDLTTWTEITNPGTDTNNDAYGNTRLSDTGGPVFFSVVKDRVRTAGSAAYDLLVIQNGVDAPRIYGKGTNLSTGIGVGTYGSAVVTQPDTVPNANLIAFTGFNNYFNVGNATKTSYAAAGTGITGADAGASTTANFVILTLATAGWSAPSATLTHSSGINFSQAKELVIVARNSYSGRDPDWYRKLSLSLGDGTNTTVVYDLVTGVGSVLALPMPESEIDFNYVGIIYSITAASRTLTRSSGTFLGVKAGMWIEISGFANGGNNGIFQVANSTATTIVFTAATMAAPVDEAVGATVTLSATDSSDGTLMLVYPLPPGGSIAWSAITKAIFGYSETPAADQAINLYLIAAGGRDQGLSNFAMTYYSTDTRQEGPGHLITNKLPGGLARGGGTDPSGTVVIVEDARVHYDYQPYGPAPSDAQRDAGINYAILYRNDYGTVGYYYDTYERMTSYTAGAWARVGPVPAGGPILFASAGGPTDYSKPIPDEATICLPIGKAMTSANGRFFVSDGKDRVYVSDFEHPFQFRKAVRFSGVDALPESGGSFALDGQIVQQLTPVGTFAGGPEAPGAPLTGAATIFIHTDSNLYSLSGNDARSVSSPRPILAHGTLSPFSVARFRGGFYWLDQGGQVRSYGQAGPRSLSLDRVDDVLTTIPASRRVWVTGSCSGDRYYLGYTAEGASTNLFALVWNERLDTWESRDTLPLDTTFLTSFYSENRWKILGFSGRGLYEYCKPGQGTVAFKVVTREYTSGDLGQPWGKKVSVKGFAILCDSVAASTVTIKRYTPGESASASATDGVINIAESTPRAYKRDQDRVGCEGKSVHFEISFASAPAGWRLYEAAADMSTLESGGPKSG